MADETSRNLTQAGSNSSTSKGRTVFFACMTLQVTTTLTSDESHGVLVGDPEGGPHGGFSIATTTTRTVTFEGQYVSRGPGESRRDVYDEVRRSLMKSFDLAEPITTVHWTLDLMELPANSPSLPQ
ncbi:MULTISPECIES: hypothetical protein [Streptomyces]|uniref:hypothetical protein n=1 Tax=Streptomyces TaxID=1883 RepID=UPI00345B89F5